jgi:hypothetical protein
LDLGKHVCVVESVIIRRHYESMQFVEEEWYTASNWNARERERLFRVL